MNAMRVIDLDWVEIQRLLPQRWKRKLLVGDNGSVFMSAAIGFDNEYQGVIAADDAGQVVVTFKGHQYIDVDWVAKALPSIASHVVRLKAFANRHQGQIL